jgi:hypothetical protein
MASERTSVTQSSTARAVAFCITLLDRLPTYAGRTEALQAVAAYFGYGVVKL